MLGFRDAWKKIQVFNICFPYYTLHNQMTIKYKVICWANALSLRNHNLTAIRLVFRNLLSLLQRRRIATSFSEYFTIKLFSAFQIQTLKRDTWAKLDALIFFFLTYLEYLFNLPKFSSRFGNRFKMSLLTNFRSVTILDLLRLEKNYFQNVN